MYKHKFISIGIVLGFLSLNVDAKTEKEYQEPWCKSVGGEIEYVLPDKTRIDCLTDDYAIEFDFAKKWAESLGQAMHYSLMTNRTGGIVLIMKSDNDLKYWKRIQRVIYEMRLPINTWMLW